MLVGCKIVPSVLFCLLTWMHLLLQLSKDSNVCRQSFEPLPCRKRASAVKPNLVAGQGLRFKRHHGSNVHRVGRGAKEVQLYIAVGTF